LALSAQYFNGFSKLSSLGYIYFAKFTPKWLLTLN